MINSVFSAGHIGLQNGIRRVSSAAQGVAQAGINKEPGLPSRLSDAMLAMKHGEHQVGASAAVVKAADDTLGTVIDILT